jgi:HK97 family phage major capsid protein
MKITAGLKTWAVSKGLAENASELQIKRCVADALADGSLTHDDYLALTSDAPNAGAKALLERIASSLESGVKPAAAEAGAIKGSVGGATPEPKRAKPSAFERAFSTADGDDEPERVVIEVVGVHERYDNTRKSARFPERTMKGAKHSRAGQLVTEGGDRGVRTIEEPSELDLALCGAYVKFSIASQLGGVNRVPRPLRMTEHDSQLMQYALAKAKWGGVLHGEGTDVEGAIGVKGALLTPSQQKALIDDATSGGLEIAPIAFDDAVIMTPLLFSEFYQRVNTVPITRGRRIEGASMGNVTISGTGGDDTNIPLFNTASFIAAFDTTIFPVNGAVEIGLDFISDSPIDVANTVVRQYGNVLLAWLDEQVCIGDGTTEPEGVLNASGTTSVNAENGAGGPPTVGDYENLLFGVAKAFKAGTSPDRITFGANETTYQRARGIAVSTTDQRRVFGMTHEDYVLLNRTFGIGEFFTNRQSVFVNWARYRMYRRLGLTIKVTTEGSTLTRKNLMLLTARARYGGQLEDGGAAAVCADGQS